VCTQCQLREVRRSSLDYRPGAQSEEDRELMRLIYEIYLLNPCIGTRPSGEGAGARPRAV
jgi:hypothetical protein